MKEYYTTRELMDYFGVSRYAVYRATERGDLPVAKREGVNNLYRTEDVKRYIEQSSKGKIAED